MENWTSTVPPETKVSVIVPLYGFWKDSDQNEFSPQLLQAALSRLSTQRHKLYFIFLAENARVPNEIKNIVAGMRAGGNVLAVDVPAFATYNEYIQEGMSVALEETDSKFLIVANPWMIVRSGCIDMLLERLNKSDISIVSGTDLRTYEKGVPINQFDDFKFNPPREFQGFCFDFWGITRQFAEMITLDTEYRTHYFLARDMLQILGQKKLPVITSEFFPIYSMSMEWSKIESPEDYAADKNHFMEKWSFDPSIPYGE